MIVKAFVPSVNQSIEIAIEEISVHVTEPLNDGFLNFVVGSEMATCQLLLQQSEEMKITWCDSRAVVDVLGRYGVRLAHLTDLPSSKFLHQNYVCFRDITFPP
ncbi:hypothetical protein AVEN_198810-1 [Araneus ventricosus]|uniref:Uncharacterized protein n=1 Tax=Araneus ventricosus TaxID=182803 RepID=A0A4Y2KGF9_ARAVE|nr:hypothetical protein AVEN_198810-1 [Araneus ventricosus]